MLLPCATGLFWGKVLPCGHLCGRPCWEVCDDKNCVLCPAKPKPKPMPRPETKAMPVQKAPIVQPPIAAPALPPPPPPPLAQPQPEPTPPEAEPTATLNSVDALLAAAGNVTLSEPEHQSTVNPPLPRHYGEDRGFLHFASGNGSSGPVLMVIFVFLINLIPFWEWERIHDKRINSQDLTNDRVWES